MAVDVGTALATLVSCDVWFPVGVLVCVEMLLVVAGLVAAPVPVSVAVPELLAYPVVWPDPVPVDRPVVLFVRCSVWVAVVLWVREALVTLVTGPVPIPLEVLVGLVAMEVAV